MPRVGGDLDLDSIVIQFIDIGKIVIHVVVVFTLVDGNFRLERKLFDGLHLHTNEGNYILVSSLWSFMD